jgi:hypothetical protein
MLVETDTWSSNTPVGHLCHEAAAEIERLRGVLIDILKRWDTAKPWWPDKVDTDRELYQAANAALKLPPAP